MEPHQTDTFVVLFILTVFCLGWFALYRVSLMIYERLTARDCGFVFALVVLVALAWFGV